MAARTAATLFLLGASSAYAAVCDDASSVKDPCFKLSTGQHMPQVAMGTWSGSYNDCGTDAYTCANEHARFAVETWMRLGGTHIDAANNYRTQPAIAEALKGTPRNEVFITTKCPGPIGFEALIQCADDNLQMLGQFTDQGPGYIDLLLIHFPRVKKPMCRFFRNSPECAEKPPDKDKEALQDTWRAMEELKRIGVVKSIGVSDYNITQLSQTLEIAKVPIEVHQVEWNPKHHEDDMLAFCHEHGIQLQAWSPLGGARGSVLSTPTVTRIAKAHNVSTAQVVLKWSVQQNVAVVVGTANPDHAANDMDLFGFNLTLDEVKSISALQEHSSLLMHI